MNDEQANGRQSESLAPADRADAATATTVVLSYAPATERVATALSAESYRTYLCRTRRGPVAVGDEFGEFVSCGCGTTRDITLRVEDTVDGAVVTNETRFVFEPRDERDG